MAEDERGEILDVFGIHLGSSVEQQRLLGTQQGLLASAEHAFKRTKESYADWLADQEAASGNAGIRGSLSRVERREHLVRVRDPRLQKDRFARPAPELRHQQAGDVRRLRLAVNHALNRKAIALMEELRDRAAAGDRFAVQHRKVV